MQWGEPSPNNRIKTHLEGLCSLLKYREECSLVLTGQILWDGKKQNVRGSYPSSRRRSTQEHYRIWDLSLPNFLSLSLPFPSSPFFSSSLPFSFLTFPHFLPLSSPSLLPPLPTPSFCVFQSIKHRPLRSYTWLWDVQDVLVAQAPLENESGILVGSASCISVLFQTCPLWLCELSETQAFWSGHQIRGQNIDISASYILLPSGRAQVKDEDVSKISHSIKKTQCLGTEISFRASRWSSFPVWGWTTRSLSRLPHSTCPSHHPPTSSLS